MQDVPLGKGLSIRAGSVVTGRVVNNSAAGVHGDITLSFKFDTLTLAKAEPVLGSVVYHKLFDHKPKQTISVTAHMRALASPMEILEAQTPTASLTEGDPATTVLVGGDVCYWGGGPVMNRVFEVVGTPVWGGVLSALAANSERGCGAGDGHPQALWVFSADACGTYGLGNTKIATGIDDPPGEITLTRSHEKLNVRGGSGMLLVVDGSK